MPNEVSGGGDRPQASSLETRVSALEARLARLETAVDELRKDVQALNVALARVDGKISSLPTTFQLVFILAGFTVATFVGATGLSLAVVRLAGGH